MHKTFKKLAIAAMLVASTSAFAQTKLTLGHNAAVGNPSFDVTNNMVLIGTDAGVLYGVIPPLN